MRDEVNGEAPRSGGWGRGIRNAEVSHKSPIKSGRLTAAPDRISGRRPSFVCPPAVGAISCLDRLVSPIYEMGTSDDVLDALADQARTLAGAKSAWAASLDGDVVVSLRNSGPATHKPTIASLLHAARAAHPAPARDKELLATLLPGSAGAEGLLVIAIEEGSTEIDAPGFDTALRALATLAGLRLENARLAARIDAVTMARESLLASVSHDLRNPLNTFAMSTGLLRDDMERKQMDPARGITLVTRMDRATSRMQSMIEDLVEASRIDAGKVDFTPKPENAAQLLRDAQTAAAPTGKDKAPAIVIESADENVKVLADRGRALQLLAKVIQYCTKATGDSGAIHFAVAQTNDGIVFTANGYGPGQTRLTRLEEGRAGLALLLARGLTTGQKGTFTVDTADGLVVRFTLPAASG